MGCTDNKIVPISDDKPKYFHELPDEEKQKLKQEIEDQDKNIEEKLKNPKESYENYDWDALKKKLPVEKTKEDRKNRLNLWKKLNEYGNGYISFKRLNVQLTNHLHLPEIIRNKGPIKLAFDAACNKYERNGINKDDNLLEWMEFRIFLVYLRQYFEYWVMFQKLDTSGDLKISLEEFKKALPIMKNWGVEIKEDESESVFNSIDSNGEGSITFSEFCKYAIQKSLDLENDNGFDDEELKHLK